MIRSLAKMVAFKKAPKTMFALMSPIKALKWGAAFFLVKKLIGGSKDRTEQNRTRSRTRHA